MCNKNDYIKQQVENNEIIYIDTCSLMNPNRLIGFLEYVKPLLLNEGKRITIHNCVMEELRRLQMSSNSLKRDQANIALDIIAKNRDSFEILSDDSDDSSDYEYFADKELLKDIFDQRRNHTILLISNDRKLTFDAYNFNKIESVNGNKIHVCYLSHYGDLNICDCVKDNQKDCDANDDLKVSEKDEKPKIVVQKEYIASECSKLETIGIPLATMMLGILLGFSGSKGIKNL